MEQIEMFKPYLIPSMIIAICSSQMVQANATWAFNTSNCYTDCSGVNSNSYGNTQKFGTSSSNVNVSAFSTTSDIAGKDAFETANLDLYYGGLGVTNRDSDSGSPQHAIDNNGDTPHGDNGEVDVVKFSFNENVSLQGAEIGWHSGDSDLTVLAHDGVGDKSLLGKTFAQLLQNGWNLIGHYSDLQNNVTEAINAGDYFSSDWLISAYTPEAGSPSTWSFGNDYFKLSKLIGEPEPNQPPNTAVPEPSSLLLLLIGLVWWGVNRKNTHRSVLGSELLPA